MIRKKDALDYHTQGRPGKIEVVATKPCTTQRDLSLAYSPGVAEPCLEIHDRPSDVFKYTNKGNLVAVVSNGTAVLGLGNIGALASKPVMEGKGVLFKRFAGIDVFDIELASTDIEEIINTVKNLEPTFGGINLEDIKAPECFEIEERLKGLMKIPVFHDDQHGTAIISGAALLNALDLAGKNIHDVRIVVSGAGASAIACTNFYIALGADPEKILMADSKGILYEGRQAGLNKYKQAFVRRTEARTLADAMAGADVLLGCSVAGQVTKDMVASMADNPIVFALANPDPEISYPDAVSVRSDIIMATGRSDYPNQVNNVLGFPFIFRGALDVRARAINEEMKIAAARALAGLAKEDVPEQVARAYGQERFSFGRDYIIPKPFDPRVLFWVAPAVAKAAMETGVATIDVDLDEYRERLEMMMDPARESMRVVYQKARRKTWKPRIVFSEGHEEKILQACQILRDEKVCVPVLIGKEDVVRSRISKHNRDLGDVEIIDPSTSDVRASMVEEYYKARQRHGVSLAEAKRALFNPNVFGTMMLQMGHADGLISGLTQSYPETIRPILQIVKLKDGVHRACGVYMMVFKNEVKFFADTTVNVDPSAEQLADIAITVADRARYFDVEPRIAMLSFSNFGSARHPLSEKVRDAVKLVRKRRPNLEIDGEMQADAAVNTEIMRGSFPFCRLTRPANVLIFPDLASGNIAYKLMRELGGAEAVGPMLLGMRKPVNVLQMGCSVNEIVHIAAVTAVQAHEEALGKQGEKKSVSEYAALATSHNEPA